jgi:hypothetical protein
MRVTIIADDAAVYVDGLALWPIDLTGLSSDIHAVQWYDTWGEVEYRSDANGERQQNARITDLSPYQVFIDRHAVVKAAADAAAAELARQIAAAAAPSTGAVRVIG